MRTKTLQHQGSTLFYRIQGDGPCVVLLPGFGEDGTVWRNLWNQLPGFLLLIPDLPGTGRSGMMGTGTMDELGAVLHTLLQAEGIDRCVLIGHSMGGYVALAFLERYPEMVAGLGLFHSTAFADTPAKKETREKGIAFMEKYGAGPFLATTTPNLFAPAAENKKQALVAEALQVMQGAQVSALTAYYRGMMARPDRTYLLRDRPFPILFVLGKHDTAIPLADGLQQAHLPQWADVHLLQNSGHMGMMEEPEECNKLIRYYLDIVPFT